MQRVANNMWSSAIPQTSPSAKGPDGASQKRRHHDTAKTEDTKCLQKNRTARSCSHTILSSVCWRFIRRVEVHKRANRD